MKRLTMVTALALAWAQVGYAKKAPDGIYWADTAATTIKIRVEGGRVTGRQELPRRVKDSTYPDIDSKLVKRFVIKAEGVVAWEIVVFRDRAIRETEFPNHPRVPAFRQCDWEPESKPVRSASGDPLDGIYWADTATATVKIEVEGGRVVNRWKFARRTRDDRFPNVDPDSVSTFLMKHEGEVVSEFRLPNDSADGGASTQATQEVAYKALELELGEFQARSSSEEFFFTLVVKNPSPVRLKVFCVVYGKNDRFSPPRRAAWPYGGLLFRKAGTSRGVLTVDDISRDWDVQDQFTRGVEIDLKPNSEERIEGVFPFETLSALENWRGVRIDSKAVFEDFAIWVFSPEGKLVKSRNVNVDYR